MASNYPPGVTDAHPYFNPPGEEACEECGEDVYPGYDCDNCGEYCRTEDERRYDFECDQADNMRDAMIEDGYDV